MTAPEETPVAVSPHSQKNPSADVPTSTNLPSAKSELEPSKTKKLSVETLPPKQPPVGLEAELSVGTLPQPPAGSEVELSLGTLPPEKPVGVEATPAKLLLCGPTLHLHNRLPWKAWSGALFMLILSAPYALLMLWLLCRVASQPTTFVWTTSVLVFFYFSISTILLSATMKFNDIFFQVSYIGLLSVAARSFISSNSGAAIATLLTFYTSWLFGCAVAEQTPPLVVSKVSKSQHKGDQKHSDEFIYFILFQVTTSVLVLVRMVSLVLIPRSVVFLIATSDHSNEALLIVEELSLETIYLAWTWCCLLVEEGTISMQLILYKIPIYITISCVLRVLLSIFISKTLGLIVLWTSPIAMTGFFGYVLTRATIEPNKH